MYSTKCRTRCHGFLLLSDTSRRCQSSSRASRLSPMRASAGPTNKEGHYNLSSFLAYAAQNDLATDTTTYVGTHYEYIVQNALVRLGLRLTRTGGRLDRGIDLAGYWALPPAAKQPPLKVLIQCKALARKPMPNLVRELEGTFAGAPTAQREEFLSATGSDLMERDDVLEGSVEAYDMAFLVTPREATRGVRDTISRSQLPLGFIKADLDGTIEQLLWNQSAAQKGLQGLGVTIMHRPSKGRAKGMLKEICLTWMGQPL